MAHAFDRVVVVFNPNSTGDAQERAEELKSGLAERASHLPVELRPTEYAGHAREIAREEAGSGSPLIVSVSGDGGYNEVVDGLMQAGETTASAAVLAAGNANDHRRVVGRQPLLDAIVAGRTDRLDLLRLTRDGEVSYAHSYIGLGITPVVALELERGGKGSFKEIVTTVRAFSRFHPFSIEVDGRRQSFDSLVLANIAEMAKVATLAEDAEPDDGVFEVVLIPHRSKLRTAVTAAKAALRGLGAQPSVKEYAFTTIDPMPAQIDGEVLELKARTSVRVDIAPGALSTVR
ncbi:diacylglycerol/lipid kinase family protein [Pseudonocardia xishanensis]|uniref:DAGKc domain-containing protein n=1 Tax=Pseudonocardia xishanensis TaxID=630995 RepID=A0ABP8RVF8_9PSEU